MVVLVFVVRPLSSSDMQLKLFSFSTDICAGFHTIYCMFINFPFWPEMAKMMILSDCYQVNLMIDHNPAQLKIGFINFTAISEYYLLFLDIFFRPPLTFKLEIVLRSGDCESFTISAWFVMKVSCCQPPAPSSQSYHMWGHRHICIQCELHISQTNIFISLKIVHVWNASNLTRSLPDILIAVPELCQTNFV